MKQTLKNSLVKDKKAMSVGDIYPVVLTICLVAILIAIVLFVLGKVGTQMATDEHTMTNETAAWANISGYGLKWNNASSCNFNTPVLTAVWANTPSQIQEYNLTIPLGNVSVTSAGVVTNATTIFNATTYGNLSLTYNYKSGGTACVATGTMTQQLVDFIPWIGIILLVIAAAIVIGVLVRNLAGNSRV